MVQYAPWNPQIGEKLKNHSAIKTQYILLLYPRLNKKYTDI